MNPDQKNDQKPGSGGKDEKKSGGGGILGSSGGGKDEKKSGGGGGILGSSGGGKDEKKSGGGKDEKKSGGGKDECKSGGGGGIMGSSGGGKDDKCEKSEDSCKGLEKAFQKHAKSGNLSKDDAKKWLKSADLLDEKKGVSEKDFEQQFDKCSKGEKEMDFKAFKECIENMCKEKKKEPKEFFEKLEKAGCGGEKECK